MKGRFGAILMASLMIFTAVIGLITFESEVVRAQTTHYVGGTGGGNFSTIQDAINFSNDGDTVFVYNGTYYENVIVNKTINLIGLHWSNTTIDGGGSGNVVYVNVSWVNITGFTITNGTYGMVFDSSSNNSITNNNIHSNKGLPTGYGIIIGPSSNNNITNNNVSNNDNGIYLGLSSNNIIAGNNILSNDDTGIWFDGLSNSTISNNNISMNGGYGISLTMASNNTITGNNASNNRDGIDLALSSDNTIKGNNVSSNTQYGIHLSLSSYNSIMDNNVTNNLGGISLNLSSNNNITNNNVTSNDYGINLTSSSNNDITFNNVSWNNEDGIHLEQSSNNNILNNDVSVNTINGIHLESSSNNNTIAYNNLSNNWDGIHLASLLNNSITNNNVSFNNDDGIDLFDSSNYTNITNNNVFLNNDDGIILTSSSNNTILNNDVWNNLDDGILISTSSDYNLIQDNNVYLNDDDAIQLEYSSTNNSIINNSVYSNTEDGILLYVDSNYNNVTNNLIWDNREGMYIERVSNIKITDNSVWNNSDGIYILRVSNINITGSSVWNNSMGIYSERMSNSYITNNYVWNNTRDGITLQRYSDYNNVTNNHIWNNSGDGMYIRSASNNNVSNNEIYSNNDDGILIDSASNRNMIIGNNIFDCDDGIVLYPRFMWRPYQNQIIGNEISNTRFGIHLYYVPSNTIKNNMMTSCGIVIQGNQLQFWNEHDIDTFNMVNGKPVYYWKNMTGGAVQSGGGEVILANCTNVEINDDELTLGSVGIEIGFSSYSTITGNNASSNKWAGIYCYDSDVNDISGNTLSSNNPYGIWLDSFCEDNNITSNQISENRDGIYIYESDSNNIIDNNILDNEFGTYLDNSAGNIIVGNNISNNNNRGIYLFNSDGSDITNNNISNNEFGIYLDDSAGNNIADNNVSNNNSGIYLFGSNGNSIINNNASNNDYGVYLNVSNQNNIIDNIIYSNDNFGFYLVGSLNNNIYHNNIINNVNQAYDDIDANLWNATYPTGGNYWSDYSPFCPDLYSGAITPQITGSPDGICDTQYDIDANSTDYYPLKNPWDSSHTPPTAPIGLSAIAGIHSINISWNEPISNGGLPVINYTIYRGETPGVETYLTTIGNLTFYNDTSVSNWITYYYVVGAVNILGEGPSSNEDNATPISEPNEPTGLGTSTGDSYVNLTWNDPSNDGGSVITGYNIYRNGTVGVYAFVPAGQLWYYDINVTNGITYTYNVSANNSVGEGPKSIGITGIPMTTPSAPENLRTEDGNEYVNLTWDIPIKDGGFAITDYYIYRDGIFVYSVPATQRWYNDTGLTNGITYTYNVSAINVVGEGPNSTVNAIPMTIPLAPQNLKANVGDEYVHLTWIAPSDDGGSPITVYNIYRNGTIGIFDSVSTQLWYNDTDVINGISYTYYVTAENIVGEGPKSTDISATPLDTPSAPQNLQVNVGDEYVYITWVAPSDDGGSTVTGFNIYREGTVGVYGSVSAGQLWYNDTDVVNGITYTYRISANNIVGEGLLSDQVIGTPGTIPSIPTSLAVSAGDSYVYLTWSSPASTGGFPITNYTIYRGDSPGNTTYLIEVGDIPFYNDTGVTNKITYYYRLSATNIFGEGTPSNAISARPDAPVAPINQPPTCSISSPLPGAKLNGTVKISGNASDPDGVVQGVWISIDGGDWTEVSGTTSWNYSLDTSTIPNGDHIIRVRAYDGKNYSSVISISVEVDNPSPGEEDKESEFPLIPLLIIIIIVIILLIILFGLKRKKPEEEEEEGKWDFEEVKEGEAPEGEAKEEISEKELPPPPPWVESEEPTEEEKGEEPTEEEPEEEKAEEEEPKEEKEPSEEEFGEERTEEETPKEGKESKEEEAKEEVPEKELPPPP